MLPNPVVVIPGITANYLTDAYPLPPETIWSVLSKDYSRAGLHPDNVRYEAVEPALVRAGQLFEICYDELIKELRYNLREQEDEAVPVYPFAYDWRQPLEDTAEQLRLFIDEVATRTALMRHYSKDGYDAAKSKVNVVAHSMGGLVTLAYLVAQGAKSRIAKVTTLATPFRGAFESIIKITTGTANLGPSPPSSREREAARMTPALYYLLPDLPESIEVEGNIPKDLFDIAAWQPSVLDTIEEYIRLHGLDRANRRTQARELFTVFLKNASSLRTSFKKFNLSDAKLSPDDWLCVVGVNADTRVRVKIKRIAGKPEFEFRTSDRVDHWESTNAVERVQTGDGTVPFNGAMPHFLPPEKVVCVTPGDYGYWELQDMALMKVGGFHGIMPTMDMLHRLIVRFFKNQEDRHKNTWGMPPPSVPPGDWKPPLRGGLRVR